MQGAKVLAGTEGVSNPVESITVLEYGKIGKTLDKLFEETEFQGNELIISSFADIVDDVDAQCDNIRKYHAVGSVGIILFYVGLILPQIDDRLIACCDELGFVLITMPSKVKNPKYSDIIADVSYAIFRDQQTNANFASTLIRRFSDLSNEHKNINTVLRLLSNHLKATIMLVDYKKRVNNFACWPQALPKTILEEVEKSIKSMNDSPLVKIELSESVGYLQQCPSLFENVGDLNLYTFKFVEQLSRESLWQASEFLQLYSNIWNKDLGKAVTSELIRAIIDDEPLKMQRLAKLFRINVEDLNQMWIFESIDNSEPNQTLLSKCSEYFSSCCKSVLMGLYESNIIIFTHAAANAYEREYIINGFKSDVINYCDKYRIIYCDCLDTTNDVNYAYFNSIQYANYAELIYPSKLFFRLSDIAFAKNCYNIMENRESYIFYEKIIEKLEKSPEQMITLATYLIDSDGNMSIAAKKLHCHLNTVKYRLNMVRDRLGLSPTKMSDAFHLMLALAIHRLTK